VSLAFDVSSCLGITLQMFSDHQTITMTRWKAVLLSYYLLAFPCYKGRRPEEFYSQNVGVVLTLRWVSPMK
jgi:hypothetical protein